MNRDVSVKFFHSQYIIILMIFTLHVHPQAMWFGHTDGSRRARYDALELVGNSIGGVIGQSLQSYPSRLEFRTCLFPKSI